MQNAIALFEALDESDVDWILAHGSETTYEEGTKPIREGDAIEAILVVLKGTVGVCVDALEAARIATLGPGEIVGEMAFLEGRPASASVVAEETATVLEIPLQLLHEKVKDDPAFAARLYRSLAQLLSQRLRAVAGQFGNVLEERLVAERSKSPIWRKIAGVMRMLKDAINAAEKAALKKGGGIPAPERQEIGIQLAAFSRVLNDTIGASANVDLALKDEIGSWAHKEFLPYLLLTHTLHRMYAKPRGYAGDYLMLKHIYDGELGGSNQLGRVLDEELMSLPAVKAVRNRRKLLADEITRLVNEKGGETARVAVLASGPAEEIFDAFRSSEAPERLKVTLIDIDLQALAYVADKRDTARLSRQIDLVNESLVYLATGRHKIDLRDQDLVYSMGLIDYFGDKFVVKLMNFAHHALKPGGKLILGNFHPNNGDQALMDHVLDWKLIYRTEADMDDLYQRSSFARPCTGIRFEEQGIDLFAECVRT